MNNRQPGQPAPGTKLTLKEHLAALGRMSHIRLSQQTGLPLDAIETALKGEPIAESYAKKIAAYLAGEHQRDIQISDVKELRTVAPGRERAQKEKGTNV